MADLARIRFRGRGSTPDNGRVSTVLVSLNDSLPDLYRGIDLIGVLLNGVLGGRLARTKRFDAVGFAVLAVLSALGGGMVRDTLLQQGPPVALTDPRYLACALVGAAIAMLWKLESRPWRIILILAPNFSNPWPALREADTPAWDCPL